MASESPLLSRGPARFVLAVLALAAALLGAVLARPAPDEAAAQGGDLRKVIFVGNNWDGTADVISPRGQHRRIARINIVPDKAEREAEIMANPVDAAFFLAIRQFVGEGNDQYVDDMYTTPGGELLIVSRPSFKDVVGIELSGCEDLDACEIVWRFEVDGQRSDHMAVSPDGSKVAVSASTGNVVHILDTQTGQELDRFASGDSPHENTYSKDGERIFHASIGRVYTPHQDPAMEGRPELDSTKGERVFYVVDTDEHEVIDDIDVRQELDDAGHENLSEAVRPMALTPSERVVFFQVSFFHGFVVYSYKKDRVMRIKRLPNEVPEMPKEQYLLNSAHHGIAMNESGRRLCVAGTMSDYAAIVKRKGGFPFKLLHKGEKPYWATTSDNGRQCYVSWSGTDSMSIISYRKRREIDHVRVGDHPQRIRTGKVTQGFIDTHG